MTVHRTFGRAGLREAAWFLAPRLVLVVLVMTLLLYAVASLPGVPYHVQTLFGPSPSWPQAGLFALLVLFALGPPALLGLQLVRLPGFWAWQFPVGILVHAVIVFLGFRFATPIASVHDLVGLPVWGIGDEWERLIRFVGLFLMISVPFAGGSALLYGLIRAYAPGRLLWWLSFALVLFGISYWIVVIQAATDNITALLPARWMVPAMAGLGLWLALLAFVGAVLAARAAGVFRGNLATLFAPVLVLPLSFGLLYLATSQSVGGPGSRLSALEFLLSPEQGVYNFSTPELLSQYSVAYLVVVVLLAASQYPVWIVYATRRFQSAVSLAP